MKRPSDDRGRPVVPRDLDKRTKKESRPLVGVDRAGVRGTTWRELGIGLLVALPVGLDLAWISTFSMPNVVYFLLLGSVIGALSWVNIRCRARHRFRDRRALALRAQRCPSCWYDLEESRIGPDRCVVCPECGAAWRVDATDHEVN